MEKPGFTRRSWRGTENFDLWIWEDPRGFRAQARDPETGVDAFSIFELPAIVSGGDAAHRSRDLTPALPASQPPSSPRDHGTRLFQAVFSGSLLAAWEQSCARAEKAGKDLRLRLNLIAPQLWDQPWEILHDPARGFLAVLPRTPVVRYVQMPVQAQPLKVRPPLRILVVSASPSGIGELAVNDEIDVLRKALEGLAHLGRVELEYLGHATREALLRKLREETFHVLHFIGHGAHDANRGGALLLEREDGSRDAVNGSELGVMLQGRSRLRLVVLNACQGARGGGDAWAGVAQALVQAGVPAVIAMRTAVSDPAAVVFSRHFYEFLANREPVDRALTQTRQAMYALGSGEWATPVLAMRSPDGLIFDFTLWERLHDAVLTWLRAWWRWVAVAVLVAGTILAGVVFIRPQFDLNLVFARFNPPECPSPPSIAVAFVKVDDGQRSFCIGRFELTQRQWARLMGKGRSRRKGRALPATVSWTESNEFLAKLSQREPGAVYRLPTSTEWKRAGQSPQRAFFATPATSANCENKDGNDGYENTAPVGSFPPNARGLYDMAGNVAEWVSDRQGDKAFRYGGSYENALLNCRFDYGTPADPDRRLADTGFRIVREPVR